MGSELLQFKKILVDFVKIKYPDNYNLFTNLFEKEENVLEILKTIDEKWVPATSEQSGLFSKDDKVILDDLAKRIGVNIYDLLKNKKYKNVENIAFSEKSGLSVKKLDENSVEIDLNKLSILKKINFETDTNVKIQLDEDSEVFKITTRNVVYISDEYKTEYIVEHDLGEHVLIHLFEWTGNKWESIEAKIENNTNTVKINFSEAVRCKIIITGI